MKTTVFTKYHIAAGAKMAEFAGYNMPIEFTGINDEHMAVRNGAGVFDVSHMGEIWAKGPRALDLLQRITTNDVSKLFDGKVQYTCMPNGRGGIVDDILVYRVDAETYMLCVNAANIDKDWKHICAEGKAFGMEAGHGRELYNASDEICQLAVQGPLAMKIVQKMCAEPVEGMEYYTFKKMPVAGCDAILSITGYTGSGGCEIYVANEDGDKLWKALWEAGAEFGLKNIGLGARDTLRLEKGFCLYGNDIDDTTSPLEAGLGWITKFAEGKDFIDRAAMERLKAEGVGRKLVGLKMVERGIPRHGYAIAAPDGTEIGHVTSGTMSPCLKVGVALGYVEAAYAKPGTEIAVVIREKPVKAEVVKIPFV
uniref:glycine cleavage system aminomethyltransferase GcvT n=1 Tax=Alistipes shahii TaxID=328814 RepID=UPI003FED5F24